MLPSRRREHISWWRMGSSGAVSRTPASASTSTNNWLSTKVGELVLRRATIIYEKSYDNI